MVVTSQCEVSLRRTQIWGTKRGAANKSDTPSKAKTGMHDLRRNTFNWTRREQQVLTVVSTECFMALHEHGGCSPQWCSMSEKRSTGSVIVDKNSHNIFHSPRVQSMPSHNTQRIPASDPRREARSVSRITS